MPRYARYPLPHLLGRIDYAGRHDWDPDGDTIHLRDPVLLVGGKAIRPEDGHLTVWMPGHWEPRFIHLKGKRKDYVPIRLEGVDAPEQHYRSTPFTLRKNGVSIPIRYHPGRPHPERSGPRWEPATDWLVGRLQKAGWALVMLDREGVDKYKRVLGYVWASDRWGRRGKFLSLELVKRGLAFTFLFESAGPTVIRQFLRAQAKARKAKKGVWRRYVERPLSYQDTFARPNRYTDPEPYHQLQSELNLPVVFRRLVDSWQPKGLSLRDALRKYDAMDYLTGAVVLGDRYWKVPVDRRIWAPHLLTP
jgi:endonuclease YncB( thermonuclease family)